MMHPHGIEEPAGQPKPLPSLQAYQDAASKLRTSLGAYDAPLGKRHSESQHDISEVR